MKITARVKFKEDANRKYLLQAFFGEDFSPNNTLRIVNDEFAIIQLQFETTPPSSIIKALSYCHIELLNNAEDAIFDESIQVAASEQIDASNDTKTQTQKEETNLPQSTDSTVIDKETLKLISDQTDKVVDRLFEKQKKKSHVQHSEAIYLNIPIFNNFAEDASSFEDFVNRVCVWMNLREKSKVCLTQLVMALSTYEQEAYDLNYAQLKGTLKKQGYSDAKYYSFCKQIQTIMARENLSGTIIPFLATVLRYKKEFKKSSPEETFPEVTNENVLPAYEPPVQFRTCPKVEKIVWQINPNFSPEQKAQWLVQEVGIVESSSDLREFATNLISAAFQMDNLQYIDEVMLKAGYHPTGKDDMLKKLQLSELVNKFLEENGMKKIRLITFLKELRAMFT